MTGPVDRATPVLTDGVVTLRAHEPRDFVSRAEAGRAAGERLSWAIEADGEFAGSVEIFARGAGRSELGVEVRPAVRGRGLATRAAALALTHAFGTGLEVVSWRAAASDLAAWRVAWSLGFRLDGTRRLGHADSDGRLDDERVASLVAGEAMTPRHPWWEPKVLVGERVRLRPWREDDAPAAEPDPVERERERLPTPGDFDAWLRERRLRMSTGDAVFWCLADAGTDEPLGGLQLARLGEEFRRGSGSLGYWLFEAARGRGLVADALDLLVPHAFAPCTDASGLTGGLGLHRLDAGAAEENRASQRVLRRAGFRETGRLREFIARPDEKAVGAVEFELLASDDRVAQTVEPADVPVLETERLRLRPWREDDGPRPGDEPDRAALRYMPAGAQPDSAHFAAWLARRRRQVDLGAYQWCVADRDDDRALGSVGVFGIGDDAPGSGEVGYWLYPSARGRALAGEALEAVVAFAFAPVVGDGLGLHRLHAATDAENVASHRVLARAGFREWGRDRQAYARADRSLSDGVYFERLAGDAEAIDDDGTPGRLSPRPRR